MRSEVYLGTALKVEGEYKLSLPRLALSDEEEAVAVLCALQHEVSRVHTRERAVEPGEFSQVLLYVLYRVQVHHYNTVRIE